MSTSPRRLWWFLTLALLAAVTLGLAVGSVPLTASAQTVALVPFWVGVPRGAHWLVVVLHLAMRLAERLAVVASLTVVNSPPTKRSVPRKARARTVAPVPFCDAIPRGVAAPVALSTRTTLLAATVPTRVKLPP